MKAYQRRDAIQAVLRGRLDLATAALVYEQPYQELGAAVRRAAIKETNRAPGYINPSRVSGWRRSLKRNSNPPKAAPARVVHDRRGGPNVGTSKGTACASAIIQRRLGVSAPKLCKRAKSKYWPGWGRVQRHGADGSTRMRFDYWVEPGREHEYTYKGN